MCTGTLADVEQLHCRFQKTFGFAITASQFEMFLLCQAPESVGVEEVFEALDRNHDGRVDGLEVLAALACVCRATFEDKARFAFNLFDFNHNGCLSLQELALLMKSVLIGMALFTGDTTSLIDAMRLCLGLAENAFSQVDKGSSVLTFDDFITWARRNREFMLQVERFRLIADKAVGFEDALSLPDGSDDDSDLDVEDCQAFTQCQTAYEVNGKRFSEEPHWQPLRSRTAFGCETTGMPVPMNLRLDWIYGTCGPSVRNACRFVATGEAVYFVGKYAVLYSSARHEQRYYCGHQRAIGCLAVNASGDVVATGDACAASTIDNQGGANVHVWSSKTLQCLAVLRSFHPVGVAQVSFPAVASAATATLRQTQALSMSERSNAGKSSTAVLSSHLSKKKPHETEALIASIGSDDGASMALWNWQKEAVVASGRAHLRARGKSDRSRTSRPLALALNEDGDEIVVVGAHFVVFYHVHGRFFKHKKPHWHGPVDVGVQTVPVCLSVVYYGLQTAVVGTGRGELLLFERNILTRSVQAHEPLTSVNVCLLSCQSMVLFSAGKDGQIQQWDSTLHSIGQAINLHSLLLASSSSASSLCRLENGLENDDLRISSLDYDAHRRRFLVATRMGNIFEVDDKVSASSVAPTIAASGHRGQPTRGLATACTIGGTFASCGVNERAVKLWSLRRRTFIQHLHFPGASATPSALAFSSDGERLAIGSEDGTVLLARRMNGSSSLRMTIETVMKNTSAAVKTMRFGPIATDPLLAVARANGLIYLYRLESDGRRLSRYMLLDLQGRDVGDTVTDRYAHALDFTVEGNFLRAQHGSSTLCFWDLRQRAGTRVTASNLLRMLRWQTHSVSIGHDVSGLALTTNDFAVANSTQGLTLVLTGHGDMNLVPFPCSPPPHAASWLTRRVGNTHLTRHVRGDSSCSRPFVFGDFALRGDIVVTGSQFDPALCQWHVDKELADVQPRPACRFDQLLRKRLQAFGLNELYFPIDAHDEQWQHGSQRRSERDVLPAIAVRQALESDMQRSEAPDLALTLSFAYGFNHRNMSVNQSLACLGNGSFVYGAGSLLVVRHLHAFGRRQRLVTTGLRHSVSCIVKHPSEPLLAVGSRRDDEVVLLRTEKTSMPGADDSYQQVTKLGTQFLSSDESHVLLAVEFCDANDSDYRSIQSDLVAAIWKSALSHVHTLVFYAWKRKLVMTYTAMTRLPVLFGRFAGSFDTGVAFVSGGVDHVTFWSLDPATGHVSAQQGVFGRHAVVQTITCAVYVPPFVVTGGEDGAIVVWESSVAAYTVGSLNTEEDHGVVALEHLSASQVVLGALRNGSLAVWRYSKADTSPRGVNASRSRVRASTFLHLVRTVSVYDCRSNDTHVRGLRVLDGGAVACIVLSTGQVLSVDLESILDDAVPISPSFSKPLSEVSDKVKSMLNFSSEIHDIALHPRDLQWASASADGHVSVWSLQTNALSQQQVMPSSPRSLAWSSTGDHLAVSLMDGKVAILNGTTLEKILDFSCGETENASVLPKWCTIVKYSPVASYNGAAASRSWLALACRDLKIYVYAWETTDNALPSCTLHCTFAGHTAPIETLDFSLDCHYLQSATSSNDRHLMRWSLQNEPLPSERNVTERALEWTILDDAWASWTTPFAGPVEGLAKGCGVGRMTSLARINGEDASANNINGIEKWNSPLPTMVVGLDDGQLMLAWYPLACEDVLTADGDDDSSSGTAVVTKEYGGCFAREATIRRVGFTFANAFVVALARDASGSTQVAVWKTDYSDEVRLRQRFTLKLTVSSTPGYQSPFDRTLFEQGIRAQQTSRAQCRSSCNESDDVRLEAFDSSSSGTKDEEVYLDFVYGLNACATGSRNVFYADDAWEIVYAAGACGVVYNTKTQTQLLNHAAKRVQPSVISALAVHPRGDLIASGECLAQDCHLPQTPALVIWDANSGSTIVRLASQHQPGILLLDFSPEGHRLASIGMDMDHTLSIYAIAGGDNQGGRLCATLLVTSKTSRRRVWGLSFGEDGDVATCGDHHILFWQQGTGNAGEEAVRLPGLKSGLLTSHKESNPQAIVLQVVHVTGRARVVMSSQADGSLYVWKDRVCVLVRRQAHGDAAIPALAVDRKHSLLYSAGQDGRICVWNTQLELMRVVADIAQLHTTSLPLTSTSIQSICVRDGHVLFATAESEVCELVPLQHKPPESSGNAWRLAVHVRGHATGAVVGLAVHPSKRAQFASAGDDGTVRLWDAATHSLLAFYRWSCAFESTTRVETAKKLRTLAFSSDGKHLAVGTDDGVVRILTAALDRVVTHWSCWHDQEPRVAIVTLQYSHDNQFLAVACQDGSIHVYDAAGYRRITILRGASGLASTVQLDFALDRPLLRMQCTKQHAQYWHLGRWTECSSMQVPELHWPSRRYPALVNGTTSDDFDGTAMAMHGHAAPVSQWVVTKNEKYLLSIAGADRMVCQWRLPPRTAPNIT